MFKRGTIFIIVKFVIDVFKGSEEKKEIIKNNFFFIKKKQNK